MEISGDGDSMGKPGFKGKPSYSQEVDFSLT